MSQSILKEDWHTAYEIGKAQKAAILKTNPIIETITSFESDKRVIAFKKDIILATEDTLTGSLLDVQNLRDAVKEFDSLISSFSKMKSSLLDQANEIIEEKQREGVTEEDNFRIVPREKRSNRKADLKALKSEKYLKRYEALLDAAKEDLEESFAPTVKAIEAMFGKKADEVLIPAIVQIVGFDIEPVSLMPEKAAEVEL